MDKLGRRISQNQVNSWAKKGQKIVERVEPYGSSLAEKKKALRNLKSRTEAIIQKLESLYKVHPDSHFMFLVVHPEVQDVEMFSSSFDPMGDSKVFSDLKTEMTKYATTNKVYESPTMETFLKRYKTILC